MILPMSGFFLALAILGGLTILFRGSNARAARQTPIAFSMLFAGIGYCSLALALYPLAFYMGNVWGFALLFFAPFAAGICGAMFGYRAGVRRMTAAEA
jgi:hypothetical protein